MYKLIKFIFNIVGMIGAGIVVALATILYAIICVFSNDTYAEFKKSMKSFMGIFKKED